MSFYLVLFVYIPLVMMMLQFTTSNSVNGLFDHSTLDPEGRLRAELKTGYDPLTPPPNGNEPTNVSVGINLYRLESIDLSSGVMMLNAWLRMSWMDKRLVWNESDFGNVSKTAFFGSPMDVESEIWVPDAEIYGAKDSLYEIPRKGVDVYSDGYCFYSRPAVYNILCTFENARLFPYDVFSCNVDIGGWGASGLKVMYNDDLGIKFETIDKQLSEYRLRFERTTSYTTIHYFSWCPDEPWPVVTFSVGLKASTFIYTKSLVVTNIALVYLNFALLWIDMDARVDLLSLGGGYVLAMVAVDFISTEMIPQSQQLLWLVEFLISCLIAAISSIAASSVAIYYDFIHEKDMHRFQGNLTKRKEERKKMLYSKHRKASISVDPMGKEEQNEEKESYSTFSWTM